MKSDQVEVGGIYETKVGTRTVEVRIVRQNKGGWDATSVATGKPIRVKDAARLRPTKGGQEEPDTQVDRRVDEAQDAAAPAPATVPTKAPAKAAKQAAAKAPRAAKAGEVAPGRMSCLDAAAAILKADGGSLTCKAMVERMAAEGLWTSTAPTPAATLSSAILREMTTKRDTSRFAKTGRGLFALHA